MLAVHVLSAPSSQPSASRPARFRISPPNNGAVCHWEGAIVTICAGDWFKQGIKLNPVAVWSSLPPPTTAISKDTSNISVGQQKKLLEQILMHAECYFGYLGYTKYQSKFAQSTFRFIWQKLETQHLDAQLATQGGCVWGEQCSQNCEGCGVQYAGWNSDISWLVLFICILQRL